MLDSSFKGRTARAKRHEMFWNSVTKIVGCSAVVVIVAVVMFVMVQKLLAPPRVDEDYIRAMTDVADKENRWSGDATTEQSLFDRAAEQSRLRETKLTELVEAKAEAKLAERLAANPGAAGAAPVQAVPVVEASVTKTIAGADGIADLDAKRAKIAKMVEAFFAAKDVEGKLPYVRDPVRVKPLMTAFYSREPMPSYKWRGLNWIVSVAEPGYQLGYVQALFEDATASRLVIEELANGEFRVDWEGFVRYGELAWKDFLRLRPAEPKLLRVIASRPSTVADSGSSFEARPEWLELRHPEESGTVLGYFDKNDPKLKSLMKQMDVGKWKDVPLTLRLCYPTPPSSTTDTCVMIAGVEGKGWLILDGSGS